MPEVAVQGRPRPVGDAVVRRAVARVLAGERRAARMSVTFVGRDTMRRLNRDHLGHDRPTDVLSFALDTPGGLLGDVYVCPWVAAREARARGLPARQEVIRLVVHGTLHVLGWDHPEGEARTRSSMWRRQERYVEQLT
ncbi:MAG TPA: rRNA maturation RNase YbeY [Gemmatimonadales bacterium]|nr:rRNA maturation RNase YbeY [Gemmatimonadales bacterium]